MDSELEKFVNEAYTEGYKLKDAIREAYALGRQQAQEWAAAYIPSIVFAAKGLRVGEIADKDSVEDAILAVVDAARQQALEEAAKVAEFEGESEPLVRIIASAIRALKEGKQGA